MDDTGRKLDLDEISNILKKNQETIRTPTRIPDIYQPHAEKLLELLDGKRKSVLIKDYELIVSQRPTPDLMFIKPTRGFVPCGWFSRKWLNDAILTTKSNDL